MNWSKTLSITLLLIFISTSNILFAQQDSKDEERARYEAKKKSDAKLKAADEKKSIYSIELNSNASEENFSKAIKDLNDSKKFTSVKSDFRTKKLELTCLEAMIPEEIKEIVSKSGLGISSYKTK